MALDGTETVHVIAQNGIPIARTLSALKGAATWDAFNVITTIGGTESSPITVATLKDAVPAGRVVPQVGKQAGMTASDLDTYFNS